MSDTTKAVAVVKAVSLISGSDAKVAAELTKGFEASQKAGRVIMAFGLFAWEVKETKLKHGQWGDWLATHAPKLCRLDTRTGKPKATNAVNTYMQMTKDVLEDMGYTVGKYLNHISNSPGGGICHDGKFLLAPAKKLSKEAAELKQQICDRVDGKTMKQIRLGFSQVEEDEETGELKTKRGVQKGSKGLTKEMREAAKLRAEQERIEDLELESDDTVKWLEKNCDDKNVGAISEKKAARLLEAVQYAHDYLTNLQKIRKGQ